MAQTHRFNQQLEEFLRDPANDIHDRIAQPLVLLKQNFSVLTDLLDANNQIEPEVLEQLKHCQDCLNQSIKQSRLLIEKYSNQDEIEEGILSIRPIDMSDLQEYASHILKIELNMSGQGLLSSLPLMWQSLIYTWVQELITNAAKHSKAQKVDMVVEEKDQNYIIMVADQGIGFNQEELSQNNRQHGLQYMLRMVKRFGGNCDIHSEKGKGTVARITVPTKAS